MCHLGVNAFNTEHILSRKCLTIMYEAMISTVTEHIKTRNASVSFGIPEEEAVTLSNSSIGNILSPFTEPVPPSSAAVSYLENMKRNLSMITPVKGPLARGQ